MMKMYTASTHSELRIAFHNYLRWGTKYRIFRWVRMTVFFMAIAIFGILLFVFLSIETPDTNVTANGTSTNQAIGKSILDTSSDYKTNFERKNTVQAPICYCKIKGLDIMQAIYFAHLTYRDDKNIERYLLSDSSVFLGDLVHFDPTATTDIENYVMDNDFPERSFYGRYMRRFRVSSLNLTVFGFRGTSTTPDIIVDIELWLPSVLLRFFDYLFPFVFFASDDSYAKIGDLMLFPKTFFKTSLIDRYMRDFSSYIDKAIPEIKDLGDDVLCVGHSLGGGLAKLVALKYGFAAISMGGGGVAALKNKYKMKNESVQLITIVDVVPQRDLIPQIDFPTGSVYRLQCDEAYFTCHNMIRNLCQMVASCGETENTRLINYCNNYLMSNYGYNLSRLVYPYEIFSDL